MKYFKFLVLSLFFTSCVVLPKQAPLLSQELGNRISSLEQSHMSLLNSYFDQKREIINEFIEKTWLPEFTANFFSKPEIQKAWTEMIDSKDSQDRIDFMLSVGPQLQIVINEKRQELMKPLNDLEHGLEAAIREEYNTTRSINNTLTSFLVSASKVKENQQRYLDMLKITDDKIGKAIDKTDKVLENLVTQSEKILTVQEKAKAFSADVEEYKRKINEVKNEIKK
jgi:hypothetical protein